MQNNDIEKILGTTYSLLKAQNNYEAAEIVRAFPARVEQTGYDNWNGGTAIWEILFEISIGEYTRLRSHKEKLEAQITEKVRVILETETQDWYSAKIIPAKEVNVAWRQSNGTAISHEVRNNIFDSLRLEQVIWQGKLDEVEFLNRLFDLQRLPSLDSRYKDAAGDIWQHCINNQDWEYDWVYTDARFNLMDGTDDEFLRFLCETVHPIVRPNRDEVIKIVAHYNEQLRLAGWEIFEGERIAGRPRFSYRQLAQDANRSVMRAKTVAEALSAGWMAKEIERLENSIDSDPALAIGTAKELVETCCKSILTKRGVTFSKSEGLGDLTKKLTKELQLVPEGISDESKGADNIRLILRNLTQIANNLAELRGLYGTGHGRDGQHRGLQPRHARLAAASAVAFIDFVAETYRYRENSKLND